MRSILISFGECTDILWIVWNSILNCSEKRQQNSLEIMEKISISFRIVRNSSLIKKNQTICKQTSIWNCANNYRSIRNFNAFLEGTLFFWEKVQIFCEMSEKTSDFIWHQIRQFCFQVRKCFEKNRNFNKELIEITKIKFKIFF